MAKQVAQLLCRQRQFTFDIVLANVYATACYVKKIITRAIKTLFIAKNNLKFLDRMTHHFLSKH